MQNYDTKVLGLEDSLERWQAKGLIHYWNAQLPDAFIERAGRVYDRLKGIDNQADRLSKAEWVDEFRAENHYESALDIYVQCLAAVSKLKRKHDPLGRMKRKALYYLALARSMCEDPNEAFAFVEKHHGFQFVDSERKPLMRLVDSCVRYAPIVWSRTAGQTSELSWFEGQYGTGKSCHPLLPNDPANN